MAAITIRKLDESTKAKLRVRAAQNNRSMEDEARYILRAALADGLTTTNSLADAIHTRFKVLGGLDLKAPERKAIRKPPQPE